MMTEKPRVVLQFSNGLADIGSIEEATVQLLTMLGGSIGQALDMPSRIEAFAHIQDKFRAIGEEMLATKAGATVEQVRENAAILTFFALAYGNACLQSILKQGIIANVEVRAEVISVQASEIN